MGRRANIKYFSAPEGQSYCCKCDSYKPSERFALSKDGVNSRSYRCKDCTSKYDQQRKVEKVLINKINNYGISPQKYAELLEKQNGCCAICKKPETKIHKGTLATLCVDHDHETGEIRGLLCSSCNTGLGVFRDSVQLMKEAIDYLNNNNAKPKPKPVNDENTVIIQKRDNEFMRIAANLPKQLTGDSSDIENLPLFSL